MAHPDDDWRPALDGNRPTCCGQPMTPIVYGMPGPELIEASGRGEVTIGGCCISDDRPEWKCGVCRRSEGDDQAGR